MRPLRFFSFVLAGVVNFIPGLLAQSAHPSPTDNASPPLARTDPVKILFVGNSFSHGKYLPVRRYNAENVTDENAGLPVDDPRAYHPQSEAGSYGGIPGIFKKLTDEAGLHYEVHAELVSAKDLKFHYEHALPLIAQPQWTAVILQGYSTEPMPSNRGGKLETFIDHASRIEKAVHTANPAARLFLYETFPRADLTYPEKSPYHGQSIEAMATDLHDGYTRAFKEDAHFAGIARVGDAWINAIHAGTALANPYLPAERSSRIDLWGEDRYHPSTTGSYLCALVLFQEVTGIAPGSLGGDEGAAHDLGISREDAAKLQTAAETVKGTPEPRP